MEQICPIVDRATSVEKSAFSRDSWSIVRCQETGFVFLANPPDYSALEIEYAWEKTSEIEGKRRETEEPVVASISSFAKKAKVVMFPQRNKMATLAFAELQANQSVNAFQVLDIGCGWGNLMMEIYKRGAAVGRKVVPIGIEVSRQLAALSHAKVEAIGGRVICSNAVDGIATLDKNSIHQVIMSSFLEHECQPLRLLKSLHSVLASDGTIVLKVPNYACWNRHIRGRRWCGFRFPDHVNYFTPKTLRRLADEAGFTVARQHFKDRFPLSDNMYAVLRKK